MMPTVRSVERALKKILPRGSPLRRAAGEMEVVRDRVLHAVARVAPAVIVPKPHSIYVSLTANCNLACGACHYGRDFMPGHQLPWALGGPMIDDAHALGYRTVRLYGGEPLLHRDLEKYVARIVERDMGLWLTTNGMLLDKKIDRLFDAGLRRVSLGFYGVGEAYDAYVQRKGAFEILERNIASVRRRYGPDRLTLHLDWLLMRPTSDPASVEATLAFARRHRMALFVNLIHYSLPYFLTEDPQARYSFTPEDRPQLDALVERLLAARQAEPELFRNSAMGLRSVPDWLILGPKMRAPCTESDMLWIGPDGTVQMCYVTFGLGNLNQNRLSDLVMTETHRKAARDAFALNCPNCHCSYDKRVQRDGAMRRRYA